MNIKNTSTENNVSKKKTFREKLQVLGPGAIITASFIGVGTITTATQAGASFGYTILWAVVLSILATMVLQSIVVRIGIVTQEGLGEAIREQFSHPVLKFFVIWIVAISITAGSAAYIAGDLTGTSLGITTLVDIPVHQVAPFIGIIVFFFGISGSYKLIEKVMIFLIAIMSLVFITTMFIVQPDITQIFKGSLIPKIPNGSIITIVALIGTTVVPYNFFIHASSVSEKWKSPSKLKEARWDTIISIGIGGLITASILIIAATTMNGLTVKSGADLAIQLEPLLGDWARPFISVGLFSAGISSAMASPLGAAYTLSSIFNWENGIRDKRFKLVFSIVIIFGIISSAIGLEPLSLLLFAQALNGMILPIIAILIMLLANNKKRLGEYANTLKINIIGGIISLIVAGLGIYSFIDAINSFLERF